MALQYIASLYYAFKRYLYTPPSYQLPYDTVKLKQDEGFRQFKTNGDVNKVIFALNNLPEVVHRLLFEGNNRVAPKYFHLTMKFNGGELLEVFHNLDALKDYLESDAV